MIHQNVPMIFSGQDERNFNMGIDFQTSFKISVPYSGSYTGEEESDKVDAIRIFYPL